jgi:8-oxo-dGTP diphosphatase
MARAPVLAAGGIVLRQEQPPRIAVVRLRKRNEWVLPKGKLDDGETARAAAEREVVEETGHDVNVHEFLGTLVYDSGGRFKVVHYWRMETRGGQVHELMSDVREVDWLPLDAAVERLSRSYERAFLENVGPHAIQAATLAARRSRVKPPQVRKRPSPQVVTPEPPRTKAVAVPLPPEVVLAPPQQCPAGVDEVVEVETSVDPAELAIPARAAEADPTPPFVEEEACDSNAAAVSELQPRSLMQMVRNWLRRAA